MRNIIIIIKELHFYLGYIWLLARQRKKHSFDQHRFGVVWEYLNPIIQLATWGFVFGVLRSRSDVNVSGVAVSFIPWLVVGMPAWQFMSGSIKKAGMSYSGSKFSFSKLDVPISILPGVHIASKLSSYLVLVGVSIVVVIFSGFRPNLIWFQFFYYLIAMLIFVYFASLLDSYILLKFRDYQNIMKPIWRMLFFFSGPIWRLEENFPRWFVRLMDLNPFSYIITGLRNTFFANGINRDGWMITTIAFWLIVILFAYVSTYLHFKLRKHYKIN